MRKYLCSLAAAVSLIAAVSSCGSNSEPETVLPKIDIATDDQSLSVAGSSSSRTIAFTSTVAWTATASTTTDSDWITVSPPNGAAGTSSITIAMAANDKTTRRFGTVTIKAGTTTQSIAVEQAPMATLTLSTNELTVGKTGGKVELTIETNCELKYTIHDDWITLSETSAQGNSQKLVFNVADNGSGGERQGAVTFMADDLTRVLAVTQMGGNYFELTPNSFEVDGEGGTIKVTVTSSMGYKVSSMPDWITESGVESTATSAIHTFTVAANSSEQSRTDVIVFCNDNQQCVPVSVMQYGAIGSRWKTATLVHHSLVMRFTATWCGFCPLMGSAIEQASGNVTEGLEVVALHAPDSSLAFSGTSTFTAQYAVSGYPAAIVDGRAEVPNYKQYSATANLLESVIAETPKAYGTCAGISFDSSLDNNSLTVNATLYFQKADNYKVSVFLLEDGIVAKQTDNINGDNPLYVHNSVARVAVSSVLGEMVSVESDGTVKRMSFNKTINSSYKAENLRVLVYISREYGSQTKVNDVPNVTYGNYGKYYIDNALSGKVGEKISLAIKE